MRHLKIHLQEWIEKGLLTSDQAGKILHYEDQKPRSSRLILGLAIIAVLSIGFGLVSMIAANWDAIDASFKLAFYFLSMAGLAALGITHENRPGFVREALQFATILWTLAGIGLIAQVFHLPSDGWRGFALWGALTLPLLFQSRTWYVVLLWYSSYFAAWLGWMSGAQGDDIFRIHAFLLSSALIFVYSCYAGPWSVGGPLRTMTIFLGSFGYLIAYPWVSIALNHKPTSNAAIIMLGVEGLVALAWFLTLSISLRRTQLIAVFIGIICLLSRVLLCRIYGDQIVDGLANFFETILWSVQLAMMGIIALYFERTGWFDIITLFIAGRVLLLFGSLMGSLFLTGFGLILFGLLLLLLLWLWYKYRDQFRTFIKGAWA